MKKVKFSALLLALGLTTQAQEAITSSGGIASGSGGSVSYSVGQVAYTTIGSNGSVAQGVQQAYQITNVGIKETGFSISVSIFPNPTQDQLILNVADYNSEKLTYQLFDMLGKLLTAEQIKSKETFINMSNLAPSTYFIRITDNNNKVQSFKIIKN